MGSLPSFSLGYQLTIDLRRLVIDLILQIIDGLLQLMLNIINTRHDWFLFEEMSQ